MKKEQITVNTFGQVRKESGITISEINSGIDTNFAQLLAHMNYIHQWLFQEIGWIFAN